jgi:hypothetical protein
MYSSFMFQSTHTLSSTGTVLQTIHISQLQTNALCSLMTVQGSCKKAEKFLLSAGQGSGIDNRGSAIDTLRNKCAILQSRLYDFSLERENSSVSTRMLSFISGIPSIDSNVGLNEQAFEPNNENHNVPYADFQTVNQEMVDSLKYIEISEPVKIDRVPECQHRQLPKIPCNEIVKDKMAKSFPTPQLIHRKSRPLPSVPNVPSTSMRGVSTRAIDLADVRTKNSIIVYSAFFLMAFIFLNYLLG